MAKSAGSPSGKHNGIILREKHIVIDPSFYSNKDKILYDGARAKFNSNSDLKQLLLSTKNAKLVYFEKGALPETCYDLMIVREELHQQNHKTK